MRWRSRRRSVNIDDRRGRRISRKVKGGGLGVVILALVAMYFGIDPSIILNLGQQSGIGPQSYTTERALNPAEEQLAEFVAVVLADTEDTWNELFRRSGKTYQEPTLVLFSGAVESACGFAQSAVGPFYCPADSKVYLDLSFFDDLKKGFGAPGDFAQAYVIAHEVAHHVQNQLGISAKVRARQRQASQTEANQLSVRLELQADCLAGVWAFHADRTRQILEAGDIEEALNAASSIGDDRLQRQSRGYVTPDSFTHGSSAQRVRWFKRGIADGRVTACNTFSAESL